MSDKALGLIETIGLVGAIEAADAAAKAAAVVISSVELTEGTLMTIKIEGDLGAVQAAVEAGAASAEKVGELLSVHVIPNPDIGLRVILPLRRYVSSYHPDDDRPPIDMSGVEPDLPVKPKAPSSEGKSLKKTETEKDISDVKQLEQKTVGELRQIARTIKDFPLKGRDISMANKQQLLDAIKKFKDKG